MTSHLCLFTPPQPPAPNSCLLFYFDLFCNQIAKCENSYLEASITEGGVEPILKHLLHGKGLGWDGLTHEFSIKYAKELNTSLVEKKPLLWILETFVKDFLLFLRTLKIKPFQENAPNTKYELIKNSKGKMQRLKEYFHGHLEGAFCQNAKHFSIMSQNWLKYFLSGLKML